MESYEGAMASYLRLTPLAPGSERRTATRPEGSTLESSSYGRTAGGEMIAHSCGVLDPQALSRQHAFVVNAEGVPELLAK